MKPACVKLAQAHRILPRGAYGNRTPSNPPTARAKALAVCPAASSNATVFSSAAIRRSCASFLAASAASMASTFACHFPNGEAANSSGGSGYPGPQSTRPRPGRAPGMMTPRGGGENGSHAGLTAEALASGEARSLGLGGGPRRGQAASAREGEGLADAVDAPDCASLAALAAARCRRLRSRSASLLNGMFCTPSPNFALIYMSAASTVSTFWRVHRKPK